MIERLTQFYSQMTWGGLLLGLAIFLVSFVGSTALVSLVLVKLPPNYFQASHERTFLTERHQVVRWLGIVAKNLAGCVLVVFGIVMTFTPGPGFLTVLLGITLLDFPGKRWLELKFVSRPRVLNSMNRLRANFDKPPLMLD